MARRKPTQQERIARFGAKGDEIALDTGIDTQAIAKQLEDLSDEELAAEAMRVAGQTEEIEEPDA